MSKTLPAELMEFIGHELKVGHYQSVEEIVYDGLRLLKSPREKLNALRAEIQVGLDELDRGEGIHVKYEDIGKFLNGILAEVKAELGLVENGPSI